MTSEEKAARLLGIGGSEAPAVLGLDPYRGPIDIYAAKVEGYEQPDSAPMERGRFLEDGVANWYAHRTGASLSIPGPQVHPKDSIIRCTPDRLAIDAEGNVRDLSIKVPGPFVREQWGEEWTDDFPTAYIVQVQWEMGILLALGFCLDPVAHLAAPIDGDLRIYKIQYDAELFGQAVDVVKKFWRDHVVPKVPPPIDGSDGCTEWLKRRFARNTRPLLTASMDHEILAIRLQEAQATAAAADLEVEAAKNRLKEVIGEHEGIQGAFGRITWRANVKGIRSFKTQWTRNTT